MEVVQNGTPPAPQRRVPRSDGEGGYESSERFDEETLSEARGDHVQEPRMPQ